MLLSYSYVRRVFRFFGLEMVSGDEYAGVEFELEYDGEKMGEGFVRLMSVLGNGLSGLAMCEEIDQEKEKYFCEVLPRKESVRCEPRDE